MSDAWWVRPPAPPLPDQAAPQVMTTDDVPAVTRRSRRRSGDAPARRRRPPDLIAVASAGAFLAMISAGVGGVALALRPEPTGPPTATAAVPVEPSSVAATATSVQQADGGTTYVAANTLDGDPTTAWNSNGARDGKGPGISLTYTFTRPVYLRDITVRNGYQRIRQRAGKPPVDLYAVNARVRRLRVVTDAGAWIWDLADTRTPQTFTGGAGRTGSVRLEILAVYPSRTYSDVAISEVGFTSTL